ncbi:MAG TPA: hypothetical protein PLJ34_02095 [Hyphomicrobiales bacterium]|nr:hypothetical protein [Kaistiaceae bacterium]HQF30213.1 hypothetical protein [Hyphomicrobiales bacterium]
MRSSIALFGALVVSGAALAAEPYEGKWAAEAAWCRNTPATTDQVPITVSARGIEGYESSCPFTSVTRKDGNYVAKAKCSGEGETWTETYVMAVEGRTLTLTYEDGSSVKFVKCK